MNLKQISKTQIFLASIISFIIGYILNPLNKDFPVTSFKRIIGHGLIRNVDIEKRIRFFYGWLLILVPIVFICLLFLFSKIRLSFLENRFNNKISDQDNTVAHYEYIKLLVLLGIGLLITSLVSNYFFSLVLCSCIFAFLCVSLMPRYSKLNINDLASIICVAIAIATTSTFLIYSNHLVVCFIVIFSVSAIILTELFLNYKNLNIKAFQVSCLPIVSSLLILSLSLECINILNQYNIIIHDKHRISTLLFLLVCIISILLYLKLKSSSLCSFKWNKFYYPILILSFGFIFAQPQLQYVINTELFESANHGLAVNEFFMYGKIPLIETFDAHMMSQSVWGIIYGLLNNDHSGAIYVMYEPYIVPIFLILSYKLIKEFFDDHFSFLVVLLLGSFSGLFIFNEIGYLAIIALIFALKKDNYPAYLLYFLSLAIICIYKLNNGSSYSVATVISFLTLYFLTNKKYSLKKFMLSGAIIISICFALFSLICIIKNINIIDRLLELLSIIRSNVYWGYNSIGDPSTLKFKFLYIAMPLTVLLSIFLVIFKYRNNEVNNKRFAIILSLAIAYIFNLSRVMVRHSLVEDQVLLILFSSVFYLTLFLSILDNKYRKYIFISALLLCNIATRNNVQFNCGQVLETCLGKLQDKTVFNGSDSKVDRIVLAEEFKQTFSADVDFINSVIEKNETYVDFTNQSLLYALSGHEKPVYVNQSPVLVCGEFAQKQFVDQISSHKNAFFVLMPRFFSGFDGIVDLYRCYIMSEYIYQNFAPLCCNDHYCIWVKKDNYNEIHDRCVSKNLPYEFCGYEYFLEGHTHYYDLKYLPYIWASYDSNNASANAKLNDSLTKTGDTYILNHEKIYKNKGNYVLLEIDSDIDSIARLQLGQLTSENFISKVDYDFHLKQGKNKYLIRVSSDFYWYSDLVDSIKVVGETINDNINISILEGD